MTKEATFLSLEARWRSLRDSICREVMFFDTSCAGHRRCRSSGVCSCCSAGGATRGTLSRKQSLQRRSRSTPLFRGSTPLTIFDAPAVPQTCE